MNINIPEALVVGVGTLLVGKAADYLFGIGKTKTDRTAARESQADGATKTALDALQKALDAQEKALKLLREDHERETGELRGNALTEKGKRADAELDVEVLRLSVSTLAEQVEAQNRELAAQPKLKAENAKLRKQVGDLQKQVSGLLARITELEQTRSEGIQLATEILRAHDSSSNSNPINSNPIVDSPINSPDDNTPE